MGHPVYECTFSSSGPRAFGAVPGAAVRGGGRPGGLLQDGLPPPQVSRRDVLLQGRRQWQEREREGGFTLHLQTLLLGGATTCSEGFEPFELENSIVMPPWGK